MAWERLFQTHHILDAIHRSGYFEIDADTIRTVREPRLMSKFDHQANLPEIFKENGLTILPISRSRYVIGTFESYHRLSDTALDTKPIGVPFPGAIETIDPAHLYSETAVLHCAYVSGIIDDVMQEKSWPTVSGRMSSGDFDFLISGHSTGDRRVFVTRAQVEVDAGYESPSTVMLIEAKNESVQDFLIRQLYFPYRLWKSKVRKPVVPVFLTFSNDILSFFVFEFRDPEHYNSLVLLQRKNYSLTHEAITRQDIVDILTTSNTIPEPPIAFPQADVFLRVVDLLGILMENDLEKDDITVNYAFDKRQTHYYTTAGMYLGLIEKYQGRDHTVMFRLSTKGRRIMGYPYKKKYLGLASSILEHEVFQRVLRDYLSQGHPISLERIVQHMKTSRLYHIEADSTYYRRAQTLAKWVDWIVSLQRP